MQRLMASMIFTAVLWATAMPGSAGKKSTVSYAATETVVSDGQTMNGKIYVAPGKARREMTMKGKTQIIITRLDKKMNWHLMPEQKMYMEIPIGQATSGGSADGGDINIKERTKIGSETIDGVKTTKYKITAVNAKGDSLEGFVWLTKEGIELKLDAESQSKGRSVRYVKTLSDLQIGKQKASLFEIPKGYTGMGSPGKPNIGEMMKRMGR